MRKYKHLIFQSIFATILLSLSACTVDVDWENQLNNIKLDQSLVLPIGETEITLNDLLSKKDTIEFLDYNSGNDIYFTATHDIDWDFKAVSVLGNVNFVGDSIFLQGLPIDGNGDIQVPITLNIPLGINSDVSRQRIDSSYINSAILNMRVSVENIAINPSDVKLSFDFPKDRLKFQSTNINKIDYTPHHFNTNEEKPISVFKFFLPNAASTIPVNCLAKIHIGTTPINSFSKIKIETKFKSMSHAYSYGYFPVDPTYINQLLGYIQLLDFSKIINMIDKFGSFKIAEPQINFEVKNFMGIRLKMEIKDFSAYKKDSPSFDTIHAQFNGSRQKLELIAPLAKIGELPSITKFTMNQESDNGDIDQFFNKGQLPDHFSFNVGVTNARSEIETRLQPDFMTNRHRINVKMNLRFPLKFNAGSWVNINDTIENVKLDSLLIIDYIQKAVLVLKVTNKMPIGCKINATFLDYKNDELPISAIKPTYIKPPLIDSNGAVIQDQNFESSYLYLSFDHDEIENVQKIKKIALNIRMDKEDENPINFQKNSAVKVNFGVFIQGNVNLGTK